MKNIPKTIFLLFKPIKFFLPPILMAIFPLLSFYLSNISELSLKIIWKPLFYTTTVSIIATLLLFKVFRNKNKAALIVTLFNLIFFSYGHLSKALNSKLFIQLPNQVVLGPDKVLLPLIFVFFFLLTYILIKYKKDLKQIISFLAISLMVLVGYLVVAIFNIEYQKQGNTVKTHEQTGSMSSTVSENTPDIYYIVLDGYAREDVLMDIYNYDNSKFTAELKKMGFYVADSARSNYIHTYLSLPSTLNMRYLDDLAEKYGTSPASDTAARQLISNNEVTQKLIDYNYTIINFASIWEGTNESFKADVTYNKDQYFKILGNNLTLDEASITFLQTTLLSPIISEVWNDALRARTLTTFQKLTTIPFQKERKFVMVHILAPHPPYVFTAHGDPVPGAEFEFADEGVGKRLNYLNQLTFISNQITPIIQKIIKNSQKPPVVILQSDHGPGSIFGKREEWLNNYSNEGIRERSSILYAIYFPDQNYQQFYRTITPVNTFRIIFDKYFNENLKLLPDKTFYTSYENMYGFKDVTNIK